MFCAACGSGIEDGSRYCDQCGADVSAMPPPTVPPARPPAAGAAAPPFLYAPRSPRAWWAPVAAWAGASAFLLALDLATSGRVTWSVWPSGLLGIFLLGFPLLHRLEAWAEGRA